MNVFEAATNLKSFRSAKDKPVEREKVGKVLESGRKAPSPANVQSLEFIVVEDDHSRHVVSQASGDQRLEDAPVSIIVLADMERMRRKMGDGAREACYSEASVAAYAMRMVAAEEGLGSSWVTGVDETQISSSFGVPETRVVSGVVSLCYAESEIEPEHRFGMNEVVFYEEYDNQITSVFDGFEWEGIYETSEMTSKKARGLYWRLRRWLSDII